MRKVGNAKGERPLVAFYNPWSDIFLVTVWRMDENVPRIIDAEMLMGDWLRAKVPCQDREAPKGWIRWVLL